MEGWTKLFSKSRNQDYYFHAESGRKQWHEPNEEVENDRKNIISFYNSLPHTSERKEMWRSFNNFLKLSIMKEFTYDLTSDYLANFQFSVLDVGCGSGGDLGKWQRLNATSYLGFDASANSIQELEKRSKQSMKISSFVGDFTTSDAWERIPSGKFDVISCQFAAHYAFAEKQSVRAFLSGLSKSLSSRGRIILITVDADSWRFSKRQSWGQASISSTLPTFQPFGDRYMFKLGDRVAAPEWWVHSEVLKKESDFAGLEVIFEANLASFASYIGVSTRRSLSNRIFAWQTDHKTTLEAMCGTEYVGPEAWAIASIYKVFILTKKGFKVGSGHLKDFQNFVCVE